MREQLAESHDRAMTIHARRANQSLELTSVYIPDGATLRRSLEIGCVRRRPSVQHESDVHFVDSQIAVHCDSQATDALAASRPGEAATPA
jgi:hypothetical protein